MKIFVLFSMVFSLVSCSSGSATGARYAKGDCIELPWGAYTFQVAEVSEDTYFLYKVGYMGKEILPMSFTDIHKDYIKTPCR